MKLNNNQKTVFFLMVGLLLVIISYWIINGFNSTSEDTKKNELSVDESSGKEVQSWEEALPTLTSGLISTTLTNNDNWKNELSKYQDGVKIEAWIRTEIEDMKSKLLKDNLRLEDITLDKISVLKANSYEIEVSYWLWRESTEIEIDELENQTNHYLSAFYNINCQQTVCVKTNENFIEESYLEDE